jgi:hypothetical protein
MGNIRSYRELRVYQAAFDLAMEIFELTKSYPAEEKYSIVDQMRRSSRSVVRILPRRGANVAIRHISSANFPIRKPKLKKQEFGWNFPCAANTFPMRNLMI